MGAFTEALHSPTNRTNPCISSWVEQTMVFAASPARLLSSQQPLPTLQATAIAKYSDQNLSKCSQEILLYFVTQTLVEFFCYLSVLLYIGKIVNCF